jgi:hypothetical protein
LTDAQKSELAEIDSMDRGATTRKSSNVLRVLKVNVLVKKKTKGTAETRAWTT